MDAPPDAPPFVCPPREVNEVGGPCVASADCDSAPGAADGFCANLAAGGQIRFPPEGYCTRFCADDTQCGAENLCADIAGDGSVKICMPLCCETDVCAVGQTCGTTFYGLNALGGQACLPGDAAAADGAGCEGEFQCNTGSRCENDKFQDPGGSCHTVNCTVGDDATCAPVGDARCLQLPGDAFPKCVPGCAQDSDCREAEGYKCIDGTAQGLGLYCGHHEVGQACAANADCGVDPPWRCRTGAAFPGGYCTIEACTVGAAATCSRTSTCHDPDGGTAGDEFCVDLCNPADAGSCRAGYQCVVAGQNQQGQPQNGCVPIP